MRNHVDYSIMLGRDGLAAANLLYGWSSQEPRFTWTIETESALRLPLPSAPYGGFLELLATPFVAGKTLPSQRLAVTVDGTELGEYRLYRPSQLALYVPPRLTESDAMLVRLEHPDAVRPVDLGVSAESRRVAIAVEAVRFLALDQPMPKANRRRSAAPLDIDHAADARAAIAAAETAIGKPIVSLLERFASVGDNSEFGMLQRQCGVEPLGLMRFCSARLPNVIRGVDASFEGLGDPGDVTSRVGTGTQAQWMIDEKCYGLRCHTFIPQEDATAQQVLADQIIKLGLLRRSFMEDLAGGRMIYVCKRNDPPLLQPEVMSLFLALNRHAASRLLWVVPADDAHSVGTVVEELPGLMRGHIDRFAPPGDVPSVSVPGWLAVCVNAWRLGPRARTPYDRKPNSRSDAGRNSFYGAERDAGAAT